MMAMPEKMATNSTDWDSTPGTRKALYGTSWVPSSRTRDTAEPNTSSHRSGWAARATSTERSRRARYSSAWAMATTVPA